MRQRRKGWKGDIRNESADIATFVVTHRKKGLSLSFSVNSSVAVLGCEVCACVRSYILVGVDVRVFTCLYVYVSCFRSRL